MTTTDKMMSEFLTLKHRPKLLKGQAHHDDFPELTEEWFQLFTKKHREIIENAKKYFKENQLDILTRFDLHSQSGISPEEFLIFFIEKEILGEKTSD